jgi:1-acyl-sn-glycerol-3-phosphate acyltransferase
MKMLFRILLFPLAFLRFVTIVIVTFICMLLVIAEDYLTGEKREFRFVTMKWWGRSVLFLLGVVVQRNQIPSLPTYILMPNHRSYVDIFLMSALSPSAFIAKAELLTWPLIGLALRHCKAIMVKRDSLKSMVETMNAIQQSIEKGVSVTLFPEGTTFRGPGTRLFKSGSFKIAAELGIPVIPCAISYRNAGHAWVGNDMFISHFFRQFWKPLSIVNVRFGEPVCSSDMDELKEQTKQAIDDMLEVIDLNVEF